MIFFVLLLPNIIFAQIPRIYRSDAIEAKQEYIQGTPFQKDFLLFLDMLINVHPYFANTANNSWNIDNVKKKGYNDVGRIMDNESYALYLQNVCSTLHDGHTVIQSLIFNNTNVYPLAYVKKQDGYYVKTISREYNHYLGKQIKCINDVPIKDVISSFRTDVSADTDIAENKAISNYAFCMRAFWSNKPFARADKKIKITFSDNDEIFLNALSKSELDLETIRDNTLQPSSTTSSSIPFTYRIDEAHKFAHLVFTKCEDRYTRMRLLQMMGAKIDDKQIQQLNGLPDFNVFLREFFKKVHDNKIENIVIDVRNNGGGNDALAHELLSWLCDIRKLKTMQCYIRLSQFAMDYYKDAYTSFSNKIENINPNELYNCADFMPYSSHTSEGNLNTAIVSDMTRYNTNPDSVYSGNVYFLQNENTYSSAANLIIMAHDNNVGKIIGSQGAFCCNSYGDILQFKLPNTGIEGSVSHKYFIRPDETHIDNFITPIPIIQIISEKKASNTAAFWELVLSQ